MSQWINLPNEILSKIFENVRENSRFKEDLTACSLTHSAWKIPAQRILLRSIRIRTKAKLYEVNRVFLGERSETDLSLLVRKLNYRSYYSNRYGYRSISYETGLLHTFHLIDKFFPHIEVFEYSPHSIAKITSFSLLYKTIVDGSFKSLTQVPYYPLRHIAYVSDSTSFRCLHERCETTIQERNESKIL